MISSVYFWAFFQVYMLPYILLLTAREVEMTITYLFSVILHIIIISLLCAFIAILVPPLCFLLLLFLVWSIVLLSFLSPFLDFLFLDILLLHEWIMRHFAIEAILSVNIENIASISNTDCMTDDRLVFREDCRLCVMIIICTFIGSNSRSRRRGQYLSSSLEAHRNIITTKTLLTWAQLQNKCWRHIKKAVLIRILWQGLGACPLVFNITSCFVAWHLARQYCLTTLSLESMSGVLIWINVLNPMIG